MDEKITQGLKTNLIENLAPDILGPVRSNWGEHKSLKLNVAKDNITMHTHACGSYRLTVGITCAREVIETRLQSKLEVRAD